MKFSLSLPRPADDSGPEHIDDLVEISRRVEQLGLHGVSLSDHPFPVVEGGQAGHHSLDPFTLLSVIGASTETLLLQFSLIVAPYRNPFLTARMLSTMQLATRGRVIAGLGAGYLEAEFDALGADFAGRGAQVLEQVAAMRAAWSGSPVSSTGRGWRAAGNSMRPNPTPPPLWRGGNARAAIEQAVREFDGWVPFEIAPVGAAMTGTAEMSLNTLPAQLAVVRQIVEREGRERPLDICLVRTGRRWLADAASASDDLARLAELGVTWVEFTVAGDTPAQVSDELERFAGIARDAGVL